MRNIATLEELLPVMHEILKSGGEVTFITNGTSMRPMLVDGRDSVTLCGASGPLKKYDLPLYRRSDGTFVLHRIVGKTDNGYIMRGDNQLRNEYGITDSDIVGVVKAFSKNGTLHSVEETGYKIYCILRCNSFTVWLRKVKVFFYKKSIQNKV